MIGFLFLTAFFGCILLHELGHALMASRFRILTREITLLPIGGLSRLERIPDDPREEIRIALAGPATSIGIALVLGSLLFLLGGRDAWSPLMSGVSWRLPLVAKALLAQLAWANLVLAVFNLLPAFPMDGGRVLRALLALRMEYTRATLVAASIVQEGHVIGMLSRADLIRGLAELGREAAVAEVMQSPCATTAPGEALETVFQRMQETGCGAMPVVDEERLVGLLTMENIGEFIMVQAALDVRRPRTDGPTEVAKGESSERQTAGAAR
jgi:Zn-dependent protease